MGHSGYTNYETFVVAMWLDGNYDDDGPARLSWTHQIVREARDASEPTEVWTLEEAQRFNVADALKESTRDEIETAIGGLAGDLLGAAFDEVNWEELADAELAELAEAS